MPNHCTHRVTVSIHTDRLWPVLDSLQAFVKGDEERVTFDFGKIIPRPTCVFSGNLGSQQEDEHPGRNWYAWNNRRWGSKWGAYNHQPVERSVVERKVRFRFDTAWSSAEPVVRELSLLFPEVDILMEAIDEGWCWASRVWFRRAVTTDPPPFVEDRRRVITENIDCDPNCTQFQALHMDVYGRALDEDFAEEAPDA